MTSQYRVRRLLVPVDGSEFSRHAAEHAVRLAQAHGAEVLFLHVVDQQVRADLAEPETLGSEEEIRRRLREQGAAWLRALGRLAEERGVGHREEVAEGDPATVICEAAKREHADAIIIGKIGRRGARRILMGSITRRVIESTDRPVLVVTAPPAAEIFGDGSPA